MIEMVNMMIKMLVEMIKIIEMVNMMAKIVGPNNDLKLIY